MHIKSFEQSSSHFQGTLTPQVLRRHHQWVPRRVLRLAAAVGIIAVMLALFLRISYLGKTAIVLSLLLAVLGIATRWGFAEALASAIAASLFVEYFVIPPFGLGLSAPQHWIALSAFLVTAITTSELSIKARNKEREASERSRELESLYSFSRAILQSDSFQSTLVNIVNHLVVIFHVEVAALYYQPVGEVFRAGARDDTLPEMLRAVAEGGNPPQPPSGSIIMPLHLEERLVGSLALKGGNLSQTAVQAIAQRVGVALETARAQEEAARAEAVRKSDELKSVVLDALAHNLKTPLASIKAAATSLLSENSHSTPADFELLCVINEESDRLNRIMNEAVEMARLEGGILELRRQPYSIRETIYAALSDLNSVSEDRRVEVDILETLPPVDIDFCLVKQVFKQLLDNALKYSPKGTPVTVTARCDGDCIEASVADMGSGIPEEERLRVFEKCYRGCEGLRRIPGTGMGLSIAKDIVEKHGGRIWVTGREGRGAVFHVSLPLHEAQVP